MKILFLLLLSFNIFAQFKIEIIPNDEIHAKMEIESDNVNEALVDWIERQKTYKGEWSEEKKDYIAEKEIADLDGKKIKLYYKPIDFNINITDITEIRNAEKLKQDAKKALKDKLKNQDLTLEEINELLRD